VSDDLEKNSDLKPEFHTHTRANTVDFDLGIIEEKKPHKTEKIKLVEEIHQKAVSVSHSGCFRGIIGEVLGYFKNLKFLIAYLVNQLASLLNNFVVAANDL